MNNKKSFNFFSYLKNYISVKNNLGNNIDQMQKKNSKLYNFLYLVDEEVGNSLTIKAFHELNKENQENNILLNRNNSIRIEIDQLKDLKESNKIMELIDGIIFINNYQNQKKLENNLEIIKKIDKKVKKINSKKFFPKLFIGNKIELIDFFENKHNNFYKNDVFIFEMPIDKPFTIDTSCEYLIKMIQIKDNYAKFLTGNKMDEKNFKKDLSETSKYLCKCLNCDHIYNILLENYSNKIYFKCNKCNMGQELPFQEYANFNNKVLDCSSCKKLIEKKYLNYCPKCKKYICEDCIKKHIQIEYRIKEENYKNYKYNYNLSNFFCNIHKNINNGYCLDCEENICPKCEIDSHLTHETKVFNHNDIFELVKEQKNNLLLEKKAFEEMNKILEDCFFSLRTYFSNIFVNKMKEFEIKEDIINQLEFFKYDNILMENVKNLEFQKYDINYDKNDSIDKKIINIIEYFKKPIKIKKVKFFTKENLKGPYDILQNINLKDKDNDDNDNIEQLTDLCFLNNYMDKNYYATSFKNGLLKIYDDNFENRVPISIIKEFEVNESINSLEKSSDNSILLVNNSKIKKIKFSDDFKEYKVINIIEKKEELFKLATEIGEINALLTTNGYNHIKIYDFENGKELYKKYVKNDILFMKKISENKIIFQISKKNLMSSVNLDIERYSISFDLDNIEIFNENQNSEINIKKEDNDITLMINELDIVSNPIKLKKDYSFEIGINYLGKLNEKLLLLYDKIDNQIILFDINKYENVLKLFFNSSSKPISSLVVNESIDSFDLLVLFESKTLVQCALNSKLKSINLMSKLKIEEAVKFEQLKTIKPNELIIKQKSSNEIKKIISFAKDNFLIITNDNLIYNLKNN